MFSITLIALLSFLVQALPEANQANLDEQGSAGSLDIVVDSLVNRGLTAWPLNHIDLENTALGKPSHAVISRGTRLYPGIPFVPTLCAGRSHSLVVRNGNPAGLGRGPHCGGQRSVLVRQSSEQALPTLPDTAGFTYNQLAGARLTRASDSKQVDLTSLWRKGLAFGLGAERAVIVFLRHFG